MSRTTDLAGGDRQQALYFAQFGPGWSRIAATMARYAEGWEALGGIPVGSTPPATFAPAVLVQLDIDQSALAVFRGIPTDAADFASAAALWHLFDALPPAASAPAVTTAPRVSGRTEYGAVLGCTPGMWTGTPPITFRHQWERNMTDIPGATGPTYTLVSADIGTNIRCRVTATNAAGSASAESNTVGPITASSPGLSLTPDRALVAAKDGSDPHRIVSIRWRGNTGTPGTDAYGDPDDILAIGGRNVFSAHPSPDRTKILAMSSPDGASPYDGSPTVNAVELCAFDGTAHTTPIGAADYDMVLGAKWWDATHFVAAVEDGGIARIVVFDLSGNEVATLLTGAPGQSITDPCPGAGGIAYCKTDRPYVGAHEPFALDWGDPGPWFDPLPNRYGDKFSGLRDNGDGSWGLWLLSETAPPAVIIDDGNVNSRGVWADIDAGSRDVGVLLFHRKIGADPWGVWKVNSDGTGLTALWTPATQNVEHPSSGSYGLQWPDATTTGVPAGTSLTASSSISVSTDGVTIVDKAITGNVYVNADNVTFRRCRIKATVNADWLVDVGFGRCTNVLFEDCEIDGSSLPYRGIGATGITVRRCNIHHVSHGIVSEVADARHSWIHDVTDGPDSSRHCDGIIMSAGGPTTLIHNDSSVPNTLHETSAIGLWAELGNIHDTKVLRNRVAGGGYAIYIWDRNHFHHGSGGAATKVCDNILSRRIWPNGTNGGEGCGYWGVWSLGADGGSSYPVSPTNYLAAGNRFEDTLVESNP